MVNRPAGHRQLLPQTESALGVAEPGDVRRPGGAALGSMLRKGDAVYVPAGQCIPGDGEVIEGAADAVEAFVSGRGGFVPQKVKAAVQRLGREGATPLVVADGPKVLGVICLRDVVKGGIRERFADLRRIGIKTVMVTGDDPMTAAAIAAEAGDHGAIALFGKKPEQHRLFAEHVADSETYVVTQGQGRTVHEWRPKPSKPDTHWFDCLVGCAVAASMAGVKAPGEAAAGRQRKRYTQADLSRR